MMIAGEEYAHYSPNILLNIKYLKVKNFSLRSLHSMHFLLFLLFYPKIYCIFASVFKTYYNLSISYIDVSNNM